MHISYQLCDSLLDNSDWDLNRDNVQRAKEKTQKIKNNTRSFTKEIELSIDKSFLECIQITSLRTKSLEGNSSEKK